MKMKINWPQLIAELIRLIAAAVAGSIGGAAL